MFLSFLSKTNKEETVAPSVYARAIYLFEQQKETICARTDKLFAVLFLIQWFGAIAWSLLAPTRSWEGQSSAYHIQAWQSALFGACIFVLPIYFIIKKPGTEATRLMVAAAQMLWSGLLIASSGGRIETHFHVFGSLAFLAFYRDWRPLLLGSIITTVDHLIRGIYFPDTIYGVSTPERWRWIEFAAWVFFCDIFLVRSIRHSVNDMRLMALRQAELERAKSSTEQEVIERTAELKKSEQNLRDSEATIRAIFETAADSIITISENGAIETANQTCEKMFGYQFHNIFGKHISYLIQAFGAESCTQDTWPRLRDMGRFHHGALRIEGVGNARFRGSFPIEISLSYIDMKGRKLITAIIRDISERKEAERRVSEFYSIVSHELRTPLTSIRGSLGLLEGGIAGELPLETQELVGIARESCDRLIRLINDILDLKKLEAGKFEFNKVESSPAALLSMTIASTEGMAKERSVRLESGWTTKQMIVADIDRLNQVLVNLVSNAIKFSPKNGVVELSATAGDGMVRFAVRDHGKGIAVSQQHKLFNKFQQVDSSDIREQEGTGLGLAICKAIVEQHGGSIGVDSDIGKGATFWFCVPVGSETLFLSTASKEADG
ncbi:MAG: PAS domain-containing sensor histidine kinase, partial [Candidatus Obscuribacterales bacterium]|nr:PAS domain-containing sensor histidine kinase [Candidatus Obscuribacterales bacterium]